MKDQRILIIGGGLSGLSAGCHALRNGYRTTIIEHNLALGGVCTSWQRDPYVIDGCIHWLTGGPFQRLYEELEILPSVKLRTLERWTTWRDARDDVEVVFEANLDLLTRRLIELSPADAAELERVREGARAVTKMTPPLHPREITSVRDSLHSLWDMRSAAGTVAHFRKPVSVWAREHLQSERLQRMFSGLMDSVPTVFMLMVLGYLEQGYLSRPVGGTAAFRDALERTYRARGGQALVHTTVDEVLTDGDRAVGVRLADGRQLEADIVISTASAPETVLRLLGGRYDAEATRDRLATWKLLEPVVFVSFGVALPYTESPSLMSIDGLRQFDVGGRSCDRLYIRVCNDDPCFAPPGHTVVQVMLPTDYTYWATRGTGYLTARDEVTETVLAQLEPYFAGIRAAVRVVDVATPLTYWNATRSWRGAYEGWMPVGEQLFAHVNKKLRGLEQFYMAGQWVEPGGGVPMAVLSGRQVMELVCHDHGRPFTT